MPISRAKQELEPGAASEEEAELLGIQPGAPVLYILKMRGVQFSRFVKRNVRGFNRHRDIIRQPDADDYQATLHKIIRVRLANDIPMAIEASYIPFDKAGKLDEDGGAGLDTEQLSFFLGSGSRFKLLFCP
jgi:DNA-binding GntR family transcriptional regulator